MDTDTLTIPFTQSSGISEWGIGPSVAEVDTGNGASPSNNTFWGSFGGFIEKVTPVIGDAVRGRPQNAGPGDVRTTQASTGILGGGNVVMLGLIALLAIVVVVVLVK